MLACVRFVGAAGAARAHREGFGARRSIYFDRIAKGALMSKILFAFAALAAAATPAAASIPHEPATRIVRYADLDLASAAGRTRLEQRIGDAVRSVCGFAVPGDLRSVR